MKEKIGALLRKYRELILYAAAGGMTTAVNYAVFVLLYGVAGMDVTVANAAAWVAGVAFAYWVNRVFVFRTGNVRGKAMLREAALFVLARVLSLALEEIILAVFVKKMGLDPYWVKLAANIVVIIANYIASKLMIFRKKGTEDAS